VGAASATIGTNYFQGGGYVFERNQGGVGNWGQVRKLTASDGMAYDSFGHSIAIAADFIVVGAEGTAGHGYGSSPGSAYVFQQDQGGADNWGQTDKLTPYDGAAHDGFGHSVAAQTNVIVAGSYYHYVGANYSQGAAYVFNLKTIRELTSTCGSSGSIVPSGVVGVSDGGSTSFVVKADQYYHIGQLLTNSMPDAAATGLAAYTSVWQDVTANGTIHAEFAANVTTNSTPEWWLASHGLTNGDWNTEALDDQDGDGRSSWEEWIAGTDPTNAESVLAVNGCARGSDTGHIITWPSVSNRWYAVDKVTNLSDAFRTLESGIPGTPPVNSYTDAASLADSEFYRVTASVDSVPTGMVLIPAGSNSGTNPLGAAESYYPGWYPQTYSLTVSAFYMDRHPVTKAQWDEVRSWGLANGYTDLAVGSWSGGVNYSKGSSHPVHFVRWYDCVKWCNARSQKEGRTPVYYTDVALTQIYKAGQVLEPCVKAAANGYRLPTDVQWEYAARGGVSSRRFPWGDTIDHSRANYYGALSSYAYDTGYAGYDTRYAVGGYPYTSPVDAFAPNGYGLYDMAGNVLEWCYDWYPGWVGSYRVFRGGSWHSLAYYCRVGFRDSYTPAFADYDLGFRAVLPPGQ
jgi:formylglycine-generating enzyme